MKVWGEIYKDKKTGLFVIKLPIVEAITQDDTVEGAVEAIREVIELYDENLTFSLTLHDNKSFYLTTDDTKSFLALVIKKQREAQGISLSSVAEKLGYSSRNSVYDYESGKTEPTFKKFSDLLGSLDLDLEINIVKSKKGKMNPPEKSLNVRKRVGG